MKRLPTWLPYTLIGALVLMVLLTWPQLGMVVVPEASYSQFKATVSRGEIESVTLRGGALTATLRQASAVGPRGAAIWQAFDQITADFSEPERRAFHDNAERLYRL